MKKIINISKWGVWFFAIAITTIACESTEETFEEFIMDGETIYIGKADTVVTAPGFEVIRVWVALNADPKITKGIMESPDGTVSHEFTVNRAKQGKDTISFDVNLPEGEYSFDLHLMDENGRKSTRTEFGVTSYGNKYKSALLNRSISNLQAFATNAIIYWSAPVAGTVETILTYEDANGEMKTVNVANEDPQTSLDSYKVGGKIMVSSTYKPTENAIEAFGAIPAESNFPTEFLLDKSLISALKLAGDASDGCYGSSYERLTDGSTGDFWHSCEDANDQYPWVMSFDLGVTADLSAFKLDERSACCGTRSPTEYQIWGTNDINMAETANIDDGTIADWEADATAKGWVKLLEVSGNQETTFKDEIPENGAQYRYVRVVGIAAIDGGGTANFDEFTFWSR